MCAAPVVHVWAWMMASSVFFLFYGLLFLHHSLIWECFCPSQLPIHTNPTLSCLTVIVHSFMLRKRTIQSPYLLLVSRLLILYTETCHWETSSWWGRLRDTIESSRAATKWTLWCVFVFVFDADFLNHPSNLISLALVAPSACGLSWWSAFVISLAYRPSKMKRLALIILFCRSNEDDSIWRE